ncbi:HAD-IC family P-type ATPase [Scardovia wiggsiae]
MGTAITVITIATAAALSAFILWFFFSPGKAGHAAVEGKRQVAQITVKGGYSPALVEVKAGMPVQLVFDRQETGECTSHVVFSDLGIDAHLPGNKVTSVDLPELEPGDYPFACGMNMVHGTLRVSGKGTKSENTAAAAGESASTGTGGSGDAAHGSINNTDGINAAHTPAMYGTRSPIDRQNTEEEERIQEIRGLKRLILIGAILTTPVFIVAMGGMVIPGMPMWLMNPWWQAVLITPVMFYCGWPIHRIGWLAIAHRSPDMNSLVTAGSFAAYIYSLAVCIAPQVLPSQSRTAYFESVGIVITLVLVGRLLEARARSGTGNAVKTLINLRPQTAIKISQSDIDSGIWRRPDIGATVQGAGRTAQKRKISDSGPEAEEGAGNGTVRIIDANSVKAGDLLVVKGGDTIPNDGIIVAGESNIDESMITGESQPVHRRPGDQATGATLALDSPIVIRVNRTGRDTVLSQIIDLVSRAQATKAPVQKLADRISRVFVPVVFLIAIWTFAAWSIIGPQPRLAHAIVTAVSVVIIACPCALGLATPLSVTIGMGLGARNGILITTAHALQDARRIGTVVFDKTGTITRGIAQVKGNGNEGVKGRESGNIRDNKSSRNHTEISYSNDEIKPSAPAAVRQLHALGIRTILLSGDKKETAQDIAQKVGIDTVIAEVRPDGKAYWIERIQNESYDNSRAGGSRNRGRTLVAMVGDGINDAPALAQADIGFAIGTGTDIAMRSADITLMSGDLLGVARAVALSRATMRNIRQNLFFAFAYNIIGIPLAAGVLYPLAGWLLSPMIAGAAMALSSVCLVLNANRLRRAAI